MISLKGSIERCETIISWSGVWTYGGITPGGEFSYQRVCNAPVDTTDARKIASMTFSGSYQGHFTLLAPRKPQRTVSDHIEVYFKTEEHHVEGEMLCEGRGHNEFGLFRLEGKLELKSSVMTMTRVYTKFHAQPVQKVPVRQAIPRSERILNSFKEEDGDYMERALPRVRQPPKKKRRKGEFSEEEWDSGEELAPQPQQTFSPARRKRIGKSLNRCKQTVDGLVGSWKSTFALGSHSAEFDHVVFKLEDIAESISYGKFSSSDGVFKAILKVVKDAAFQCVAKPDLDSINRLQTMVERKIADMATESASRSFTTGEEMDAVIEELSGYPVEDGVDDAAPKKKKKEEDEDEWVDDEEGAVVPVRQQKQPKPAPMPQVKPKPAAQPQPEAPKPKPVQQQPVVAPEVTMEQLFGKEEEEEEEEEAAPSGMASLLSKPNPEEDDEEEEEEEAAPSGMASLLSKPKPEEDDEEEEEEEVDLVQDQDGDSSAVTVEAGAVDQTSLTEVEEKTSSDGPTALLQSFQSKLTERTATERLQAAKELERESARYGEIRLAREEAGNAE